MMVVIIGKIIVYSCNHVHYEWKEEEENGRFDAIIQPKHIINNIPQSLSLSTTLQFSIYSNLSIERRSKRKQSVGY